jgi:hypothetical protein
MEKALFFAVFQEVNRCVRKSLSGGAYMAAVLVVPEVFASLVQGYLIYKKTHPPRTLP